MKEVMPGKEYYIRTTVPSVDNFAKKVDEWHDSGIYTGPVAYEDSTDISSLSGRSAPYFCSSASGSSLCGV